MNPDDLLNYAAAIRRIESSGNYGAQGPAVRRKDGSIDHAYGAYQVMGNNIPSWTQKHLGQSLTPAQFLQDSKAQDAVFNGEFGGYVQKHGNPQDAASMWFSGRPMARAGNASDGYNTVPQYITKFNKALGADGGDALSAINTAAGTNPQDLPAGALGFAAAGQGGQGALSRPQAQQATTAGGGALFQGEAPDKLQTLGATLTNIAASLAGISSPAQAKALHEQAQSIEAQGQGSYQYQVGPNGQLIRINKRTNQVDTVNIPDAQKESFRPIMGKDDMGNPTFLGHFNERTGQYKSVGGGNAQPGPMVGGDPTLEGKARYDTLSPEEKRQVDGWFNGTGIQPSQYSMRNNPKLQKLMDAATAVYGPEMDFQKYGERAAFIKGYGAKTPAQVGGQLVSIEHTADLVGQQADRYIKLDNSSGSIGGYGQSAANAYKNATGGNVRTAVIDEMKGAAETLSGEYQTMIQRGKGGTGVEREEYAANVHKPLAAPEIQAAGLQVMVDGLRARHKEIVAGARSAAGQAWLDKHPDVDKQITETIDKVQKKIETLREKSKGKGQPIGGNGKPTNAPPPIPNGWGVEITP